MIPMNQQPKKRLAIYVSQTDGKGTYPARRAETIARTLPADIEIIFIYEEGSMIAPEGFQTATITNHSKLIQAVAEIKPDLLLRDSGSTSQDELNKIKELVPAIIHFDDFGEGGKFADLVFQTLYAETNEKPPSHYVVGATSFIADEQTASFKNIGLKRRATRPLPHLVISFGDEDIGNLSYRALRHMMQLQIPLKVTVLIGKEYSHDVSELRLMALTRRNTFIQEQPHNVTEVLSTADIVLCASGYLPYEIAVMGIPCVVLAQNEFELSLAFPKEQHGFIHLGSGRKVKQSDLLNAIMEPLLHESRRKKAIARQIALNLGDGKDAVCEAILYYLEYPKRKNHGETGKETIDLV